MSAISRQLQTAKPLMLCSRPVKTVVASSSNLCEDRSCGCHGPSKNVGLALPCVSLPAARVEVSLSSYHLQPCASGQGGPAGGSPWPTRASATASETAYACCQVQSCREKEGII